MPTYEYECQACGSTFDVFQSMTAKPLSRHECPVCGTRQAVRRLIGAGGGIIFKGSGFYATDYRSRSYREAAKTEKSTSSTTTDSSKPDTAKTPTSASKGDAKKNPNTAAAS